ncbi:MAG: glycerol-3-phosphate 1-O-acyltransferase PlsY [Thermoleophilia bacterium]
MTEALLIVGAYLVGSISPSVLLGRLFKGVDLRAHGSGNAGTTNAFRVLGVRLGLAVLAADVAKGFIPTLAARSLVGPTATVVVALAVIAGHNWSVFLRGKGGKGVATGAGALLALMPFTALMLVAVFGVVLMSTSLVSLASLSATLTLIPMSVATGKPLPYVVFSLLAVSFVVYAHRGNIRRLVKGSEPRSALSWGALGRLFSRSARDAERSRPHE